MPSTSDPPPVNHHEVCGQVEDGQNQDDDNQSRGE
jgi:hypothetical protein